jgi:hypothetical protein
VCIYIMCVCVCVVCVCVCVCLLKGSLRKGMKEVDFVYVDAPCVGTVTSVGKGASWCPV